VSRQGRELSKVIFGRETRFVRMDARGGPDALATFRDAKAGAQMVGAARPTDGQNVLDTVGAGALEHLLAVRVKIGELQVCVGVGEHQVFVF
jgi:hypothetical protein